MQNILTWRVLILAAIASLLLPLHLVAQERTLDELKEEIMQRAQKNQHPINGVKVEDVKLFLSRLTSKDPDLWAREWSRVAEPYEKKGEQLFQGGMKKEALES